MRGLKNTMEWNIYSPLTPKERTNMNDLQWHIIIEWLWDKFSKLIVPFLLVLGGIEFKRWRQASIQRDLDKKTAISLAAKAQNDKLDSVVQSVVELTGFLRDSNKQFTGQFDQVNKTIEGIDQRMITNHEEVKSEIKELRGEVRIDILELHARIDREVKK